jgi:hypothetical protein
MDHLARGDIDRETPGVGQPLCLGQVGFASPQFGCPLDHLHLELVSGMAKLFLGPPALLDETRVLECRRGLIRRKGQQQLIRRGWELAVSTGCGDHTPLTADTYADGNPAARLCAVADVGNDLSAGGRRARGAMTFQPFRKPRPRLPARDLDRSSAIGIAQAHERKVELQQVDQLVGKTGCDGRRFPPGPDRRDRGKRHEIPKHRSQAEDLGIGIDVHFLRHAAYAGARSARISKRNWSGST